MSRLPLYFESLSAKRLWEYHLLAMHRNSPLLRGRVAVGLIMAVFEERLVPSHWMRKLLESNKGVPFVITDEGDSNSIQITRDGVYLVAINSTDTSRRNYTHSSYATRFRTVTALDKAIFFFCEVAPAYSFVWVIEHDVFIPSLEAFVAMNAYDDTDLLISSTGLIVSNERRPGWIWDRIELNFGPPFFQGMAQAAGFSQNMLSAMRNYARLNGKLSFLETFFRATAVHNNLSVSSPSNLDTITLKPPPFTCEDISKNSLNWFHPIKEQRIFYEECFDSWLKMGHECKEEEEIKTCNF